MKFFLIHNFKQAGKKNASRLKNFSKFFREPDIFKKNSLMGNRQDPYYRRSPS